jgi:alpha-glucosidase (family GH31 glycosyl hydrolase)
MEINSNFPVNSILNYESYEVTDHQLSNASEHLNNISDKYNDAQTSQFTPEEYDEAARAIQSAYNSGNEITQDESNQLSKLTYDLGSNDNTYTMDEEIGSLVTQGRTEIRQGIKNDILADAA